MNSISRAAYGLKRKVLDLSEHIADYEQINMG